jgi:hypothetical protein
LQRFTKCAATPLIDTFADFVSAEHLRVSWRDAWGSRGGIADTRPVYDFGEGLRTRNFWGQAAQDPAIGGGDIELSDHGTGLTPPQDRDCETDRVVATEPSDARQPAGECWRWVAVRRTGNAGLTVVPGRNTDGCVCRSGASRGRNHEVLLVRVLLASDALAIATNSEFVRDPVRRRSLLIRIAC